MQRVWGSRKRAGKPNPKREQRERSESESESFAGSFRRPSSLLHFTSLRLRLPLRDTRRQSTHTENLLRMLLRQLIVHLDQFLQLLLALGAGTVSLCQGVEGALGIVGVGLFEREEGVVGGDAAGQC